MQESSSTSGTSSIRRTTQACDACKLRKVKCNGQDRCQQCSHLNLRCVYSAPKPRLKSVKRGQLIAKYKQSTNASNKDSTSLSSENFTSPSGSSRQPAEGGQTLPAITSLLPDSPSSNIAASPPHDAAFFRSFLHDYEVSVYPVNPILTIAEVKASIDEMNSDEEARAFVYAYVAVTSFLTGYASEAPSHTAARVEHWCEETTRARGPPLLTHKPTVRKIMTAQFMHICLMGLRNLDMAFYFLRESITMIQMLRVDHPEVMQSLPLHERARRQRLYCEAFVHERYIGIFDHRPIALPPLPHLPENDPSIPPGIHQGFTQIIKVFSLIDGDFLRYWIGSHTGSTSVTATWVEEKQKQIDAEKAGNDDQVHYLTDMQQADLVITKYWLRTLVWQMAMSKCLLSSVASKESMSLLFPVRLSSQLRSLVGKMSRQSIEIHGSGIQQKLFELTDTIANVIITVPAATNEETAGRLDDFMFLINFFFSFPRFDPVQRDILKKKLETLQSMFPYTAKTPASNSSSPNTVQGQATPGHDTWIGVMATPHEGAANMRYSGEYDTQPDSRSVMSQTQLQPPDRLWQDMTRRLSLASSNMQDMYDEQSGFQPR